jgi:hypothetical protein
LQVLRSEANQRGHDAWNICNGHDLLQLLEIGLCGVFGSHQQTHLKKLPLTLVVAYDDEWFRQSALFASLRAWQTGHPEQTLLRTDFTVA